MAFDAAVRRILESPTMHPHWPDVPPELEVHRILMARPWPYSVAYLIDGDLVVIMAVAHHRQPPGYWIDRV
jgi:toxin ParE1/3/4